MLPGERPRRVAVRYVLAGGYEVNVDVEHRDRLVAADVARIGLQELLQDLSHVNRCSEAISPR
jgi:hypothetical protein